MIARFDAIEPLAADSPGGAADQSSRPTGNRLVGASYAPGNPAVLGQRLVVRKVKKRFDGLKRPTFRSASAP
jgi:hypothetical protein